MLKVIGAGLGRTGTNSFKIAMEKLGFARCHHMIEVLDHPDQAPYFLAAAQGERIDWDDLYQGYQATIDWPSCHFWRELADHYPEAKVVLTIRDPESWYRSMSETILASFRVKVQEVQSPTMDMGKEIIFRQCFAENIDDKDHVIECYLRHNQAVRESISPQRLLEFYATDGWQPLCEFLGVPVPDEPYPNTNALEEYRKHAARVV